MKNHERRPRILNYEELKQSAGADYINWVTQMLITGKQSRSAVFARLFEELHHPDDSELETLMLSVITFVIEYGWDPEQDKKNRQYINGLLKEIDLDDVLRGIPADEAQSFRYDLQLLKFV